MDTCSVPIINGDNYVDNRYADVFSCPSGWQGYECMVMSINIDVLCHRIISLNTYDVFFPRDEDEEIAEQWVESQ